MECFKGMSPEEDSRRMFQDNIPEECPEEYSKTRRTFQDQKNIPDSKMEELGVCDLFWHPLPNMEVIRMLRRHVATCACTQFA